MCDCLISNLYSLQSQLQQLGFPLRGNHLGSRYLMQQWELCEGQIGGFVDHDLAQFTKQCLKLEVLEYPLSCKWFPLGLIENYPMNYNDLLNFSENITIFLHQTPWVLIWTWREWTHIKSGRLKLWAYFAQATMLIANLNTNLYLI